ncbi:hypothetical protein JTB14_024408 [Gonioctena quinquepunctata]|nr:hypothetical protein JTB14_024408 [Gonioctena quinquepunctata]
MRYITVNIEKVSIFLRNRTKKKPIKHKPSVKLPARDLNSPTEIWKVFSTDSIMEDILIFKNEHIKKGIFNYGKQRDAKLTDACELQAVVGLLYLIGVLKSGRVSV